MASVINYIGSLRYIDRKNVENDDRSIMSPDGGVRWDDVKPFVDNIRKFPGEVQLRCYLEQLIAIAYYTVFVGKEANLLVDEYINEIVTNFEFSFLPKLRQEMRDNNSYDQVIKSAETIVKFIRVGRFQNEINVEAIETFFGLGFGQYEEVPFVEPVNKPWIKPFLIWLNHRTTTYSSVLSCTNVEKLCIISFEFRKAGKWCEPLRMMSLDIGYYSMSNTFCATNYCPSVSVQKIPIYDYLARFNFAGVDIEVIVGKIGETCMTFDLYRKGLSNSQKIAAIIRSRVLGIISYSGGMDGIVSNGTAQDSYNCVYGAFAATRDFIDFLVKKYGAVLSDRDIAVRLFKGFAETKEQKDSASYLANLGGSASADELAAFNKELGSLEALQFISQNNALLVAQSQEANPKAAAEGEDNAEKKESESTEEDSKSTEAKPDNQDDKDAGDDKSESDEEQTGDEGEDDTTEEDEDAEGDGGEESGDGQGEESSDTSSSSDVTDMPSEDEQPNTSDPKGFKFKVANPEAETTDSVMFREEMDHFLSNILANPPEDLSPQNIQTLTSLHRYWLHTLSIGTIMGIVGSCIKRLPESLKQLTTQCTE